MIRGIYKRRGRGSGKGRRMSMQKNNKGTQEEQKKTSMYKKKNEYKKKGRPKKLPAADLLDGDQGAVGVIR